MYNRFSPNTTSKHGFDHSMISSIQSPTNAIPIWELLKITEKEYNSKYNPNAVLIPHSSPK